MSFYSRPDRLRIPAPSDKSSEQVQDSSAEISVEEVPLASISSAQAMPEKPTAATLPAAVASPETEATGSALKAWSGPETTFNAAPHVREIGGQTAKIPVKKMAETKKAMPKAAPAKAVSAKAVSAKAVSAKVEAGKIKAAKSAATHSQDTDQAHQRQLEAHRDTRILVIENDVEAADHVINILESDGYAVEIATDPTYGTMLAQSYLPHLILMGALSEQLTGADFMRSLRNTSGFAERAQVTPVLYLIDNSQLLQQRFQGLRDTPLTSTIFKPANERELLQKIERALSPDDDFPADEL